MVFSDHYYNEQFHLTYTYPDEACVVQICLFCGLLLDNCIWEHAWSCKCTCLTRATSPRSPRCNHRQIHAGRSKNASTPLQSATAPDYSPTPMYTYTPPIYTRDRNRQLEPLEPPESPQNRRTSTAYYVGGGGYYKPSFSLLSSQCT